MQASLDLKTQNIIPITPRHFTLHYSVYTLKPSKYQNQFLKPPKFIPEELISLDCLVLYV